MQFDPEKHKKAFWGALRHFLAQKSLTQAELADQCGLSRQYISRIVSEHMFGTEATRRKIAAAFGFDGSLKGKGYEDFIAIGQQVLAVTETLKDDTPYVAIKTGTVSGKVFSQGENVRADHVSATVAAGLLVDIERHDPENFYFVFSIIEFLHRLIMGKTE